MVSFANDIEEIILTSMAACNIPCGTQLTIRNVIRQRTKVQSEERLRSHANLELHAAVKEVVEELGIDGFFTLPGSGNITLVGEPDFLWVSGDPTGSSLHPKLVVFISAPLLVWRC